MSPMFVSHEVDIILSLQLRSKGLQRLYVIFVYLVSESSINLMFPSLNTGPLRRLLEFKQRFYPFRKARKNL